MSEELRAKPCPFCGVSPLLESGTQEGFKKDECLISCDNGYCKDTIVKCVSVESWNTRPIEDQLRADLEKVRTELRWSKDNLAALLIAIWPIEESILKAEAWVPRGEWKGQLLGAIDRSRECLASKESSKGGGNDL